MTSTVTATRRTTNKRLRALLRNPMAWVSGGVLLLVIVASVFAPWLAPHDPGLVVLAESLEGPSLNHPLGADGNGRDILSRLMWGGRVSLQAGTIMVVSAILCGVPGGLLAGYHSNWFDALANWVSNMLMSLPQILIIIVVIASLGSGLAPTMITLGVLASPDLFRLTRSAVVSVRQELFIDAARVSGLSDFRIIFRHILSVVLGPVLVRTSFMFGMAIIAQSGLEFLGLGDPLRPSWGGELSSAFQNFLRAPNLVIAPGLAIGLTVMALVLFGTALADSLGAARVTGKGSWAPVPSPGASLIAPVTEVEGDGRTASIPVVPSTDDGFLLQVEHLQVRYPGENGEPAVVVQDVSLHVGRGEVLGLVGESGSGKSQTSFAILGLLPPEASVSAQRMVLGGQRLDTLSERGMERLRGTTMAYVPQEPMSNLDPSFTIGYQLTEPMRIRGGLSKRDAKLKALQLLERVGIPDPERTFASYPHQLSGGMAQRVLIAGAVSLDPDLLIADEPTTAVDVTVQVEVLSLLRDLQKERNMGLILVTHNLGVVADICDRVAVMRNGRIVEEKPVLELFSNPEHEYTRMLLNSTLEDAVPRRQRDDAMEVGT